MGTIHNIYGVPDGILKLTQYLLAARSNLTVLRYGSIGTRRPPRTALNLRIEPLSMIVSLGDF